ncbi:hypothetical protein [Mucilaginibacter sp. UYCu711]|uniref:hypothetical protein n=1 Tax=Mucilaginibacter sp. UYCu711 TaxID=3156339 RepID=UPI003D1B0874
MMINTSEQALQAAGEILDKNKIKHSSIGNPDFKLDYPYNKRTLKTDVSVVSYTYMVFEEEMAFIYLDDRDGLISITWALHESAGKKQIKILQKV